MRLLARWFLFGVAAALLPAAPPLSAQVAEQAPDPLSLPEADRSFLQDGPALLLSRDERIEFLEADAAERARIVEETLRDPDPATPENEIAEAIARRGRLARAAYPTPLDVRAQLLFLNGEPEQKIVVDCALVFKPIEIWIYRGAPNPDGTAPRGRVLVYRPGVGEPFRGWQRYDGKRILYTPDMEFWMGEWEAYGARTPRIDREICKQSDLVDLATGIAALSGRSRSKEKVQTPNGPLTITSVSRFRPWPWGRATKPDDFLDPPADRLGWARAVLAEAPPAPLAPPIAPIAFDTDYPRRDGQRMIARSVIRLAAGPPLHAIAEGDRSIYKLTLSGVVEFDGRVLDEFRLRFRAPAGESSELPLAFETALRPGQRYFLRLRLTDDASGAELVANRALEVPGTPIDTLSALAPLAGEAAPAPLASANALVLLPPPDEVALGLWRAEALVAGTRITKVVFLVDGESQLVRSRPPYEAELRLASPPREQIIRAEGYDAAGVLVASDQFAINRPRGAFAVAITSPPEGASGPGPFDVQAEISVPEGRILEAVEIKRDDETVATLKTSPWTARVELPAGGGLSYLTVVATLDDGTRNEAVRVLNAPADMARVDVDLIEVFAAVTNGGGEFVRDLGESDFVLRENGREQAIQKFERVDDLPLVLGLTLDVSGSMEGSLGEAQRAAIGFLDGLVRPNDKVFALAFADRPTLLVSPTDDVGAVRAAFDGQRAIGGTALHDAIVSSLFYFRGVRGQRALVVLSDGDDNLSKLKWNETLEYAKRSGVSVYAIALGLGKLEFAIRGKLTDLAESTGGRFFSIGKAQELASVYEEIERELRSRYLLAYAADQAPDAAGFRKIDVEVKRRGLTVRTSRASAP